MIAGVEAEHLIFAATSDLAGIVRGKAFAAADLEERSVAGVGLTGSNIMLSAFGPIYATPFGTLGDLKLVPDLSTRATLPASDGTPLDVVLGDILELDGTRWSCCPRTFLRRGIDALAADFGLQLLAAFEQEFVYDGVAEQPGSSYAFGRFRRCGGFPGRALAIMRAAGIGPDSFLPEYGERQFEVTVKPRGGLRSADDAVLVREIVRACAAERGARAIFAPVLAPDGIGNGTHVHFSLLDERDQPVMHDARHPLGLSARGEAFVAGVLEHAPALTALTAPSAASYFRLRPNKWAPTAARLGLHDRGAALRICPIFRPDADPAAQYHVEFRAADGSASPYLALGAIVHAGLDGLRRGLRLPDGGAGATPPPALPIGLSEALERLEATPAATDWLGAELRAVYLAFKRAELDALSGLGDDEICRRYVAVY